ncbi:MAG: hypothetical protein QGG40_21250, partial [Myxococcota bacterium]|nr:hypothetical protein [Myxococcota bacterium]
MSRTWLGVYAPLTALAAALGWLAWSRPPYEPLWWVAKAVTPWLLGSGILGALALHRLLPGTLPDRRERLIRVTVLLVTIVGVGLSGWIHVARERVAPLSDDI